MNKVAYAYGVPSTIRIVAAVILCLLMTHTAVAQNMLTNAGFEEGSTGWTGLGCTFSISTASRSGSYCGSARNRTSTWNGINQSLRGKLQPGVTYNISAWIKLDGTSSAPIIATIKQTDGRGTRYIHVREATGYSDRWTKLSGQFTFDVVGTLTALDLYFEGPASGVGYYLDDTSVAEAGDWRTEANARIEQVRKRDARISVVNHLQYPIAGVEVRIEQIKHKFAFGSAISEYQMNNANYLNFFKDHFEWAVMENASKWYSNEPTQGNVTYKNADKIYDWCAANGITMRGHCIYWSVEQNVQNWVKALNTAGLQAAVESRMSSAVNHFKGKFVHWDVNNEMLHGSFFKDRLGPSIHTWMFQAAHAIDPNCLLFVNDYSVVAGDQTEAYKTQIRELMTDGAPVHAIGAQCHFSTGTIDTQAVYDRLDSLAELGLPIWCSEYDFAAADEYARAEGLDRFYRTAFSHPAVGGILMWGFWQNAHWRANCHIVNADWSLNQAGLRYESLLHEWTTNDVNTTDSSGVVGFRGFHGTYRITLAIPGIITQTRIVEIEPGQTPAEFTFEIEPSGPPGSCDEVLKLGYSLTSDLNHDCRIDYQDLGAVIDRWLSLDCGGADFGPDGEVNFIDLAAFALQWLQCNDPQNPACTPNW